MLWLSIQGFVCKILPEWCGDFSAKQRPDLVKIRQNRYLRNRILTDSQKSMNEILLKQDNPFSKEKYKAKKKATRRPLLIKPLISFLLMFNRQHYILRLSAYAEFASPNSHARTDVVSGIALLK